MSTVTIPITYDKILRKDRRTITFLFSETEVVRLVKSFVYEHNKREKVIELPKWYAEKEGLVDKEGN